LAELIQRHYLGRLFRGRRRLLGLLLRKRRRRIDRGRRRQKSGSWRGKNRRRRDHIRRWIRIYRWIRIDRCGVGNVEVDEGSTHMHPGPDLHTHERGTDKDLRLCTGSGSEPASERDAKEQDSLHGVVLLCQLISEVSRYATSLRKKRKKYPVVQTCGILRI